MGYWPVALEGEGSNCFSITQLVGLKKSNDKVSELKLKKYLFGNNYFLKMNNFKF